MTKLFVTRKRKCSRCGKWWTMQVPIGYAGPLFKTCPKCYREAQSHSVTRSSA